MVSAEKAGLRAGRPGAVRKGVRGWITALPFILPGLILVAVIVLYPLLFTIRIALSDYVRRLPVLVCLSEQLPLRARDRPVYPAGRYAVRVSDQQSQTRTGRLPRGLLSAGHHLMGHRQSGVPVYVQ